MRDFAIATRYIKIRYICVFLGQECTDETIYMTAMSKRNQKMYYTCTIFYTPDGASHWSLWSTPPIRIILNCIDCGHVTWTLSSSLFFLRTSVADSPYVAIIGTGLLSCQTVAIRNPCRNFFLSPPVFFVNILSGPGNPFLLVWTVPHPYKPHMRRSSTSATLVKNLSKYISP